MTATLACKPRKIRILLAETEWGAPMDERNGRSDPAILSRASHMMPPVPRVWGLGTEITTSASLPDCIALRVKSIKMPTPGHGEIAIFPLTSESLCG